MSVFRLIAPWLRRPGLLLVLSAVASCASAETRALDSTRPPRAGEQAVITCTCPPSGSAKAGAPVQMQNARFAAACSCRIPEVNGRTEASAIAPLSGTRVVVPFKFDNAVLTDAAKFELDRVIVNHMKQFPPTATVRLEGYSDDIGPAAYNVNLSIRRATAVRAYLTMRGLRTSQLVAYGYGASQPVQRCPDEPRAALIKCLAPNRRVVVEVVGASK